MLFIDRDALRDESLQPAQQFLYGIIGFRILRKPDVSKNLAISRRRNEKLAVLF